MVNIMATEAPLTEFDYEDADPKEFNDSILAPEADGDVAYKAGGRWYHEGDAPTRVRTSRNSPNRHPRSA